MDAKQEQESSPQEQAHSPSRNGEEKKRKPKAKSHPAASEKQKREPGLKKTTREPAHLEDFDKRASLQKQLNKLYEHLAPKKSIDNAFYYNKCCLSFSSGYLKKVNGHSCSETLSKMFKDSLINSSETFVDFMIKEIEAFPTSHQFIPVMNSSHDDTMKRIGSSLEQVAYFLLN
jgi:hypothetical protein